MCSTVGTAVVCGAAVAEGPAVLDDPAAEAGLAVDRARAVERAPGPPLRGVRRLDGDHGRRRRVDELVGAEVARRAGAARLAVDVGRRVAGASICALVDRGRVGAQVEVALRRVDEQRLGRGRLVGAGRASSVALFGGERAEQAGVGLRRASRRARSSRSTVAAMLPGRREQRRSPRWSPATMPFAEPAIVTWRAVTRRRCRPRASVPTPVLTARPDAAARRR